MLVAEVNYVRWFVLRLRQVPDLEVFVLVDGEELAQTSCKPRLVVSEVLRALEVLVVFVVVVDVLVFEVEQTPLNLSDGKCTLVVPHRYWSCVLGVKQSKTRSQDVKKHLRYGSTRVGSKQESLV